MENLPQEHQGLVFVKAEPPPQVCSSRMTDTILKKNNSFLTPIRQVSFKLFLGTLHSNTGKKPQHFHHLELYYEKQRIPWKQETLYSSYSHWSQQTAWIHPAERIRLINWRWGRKKKTLGQIPAGVNQCNPTQVNRVVPIQASCGSNPQCVLQVYFQLFRALLCCV